ncbi:conserved hypothetical protein, partial [Ricinus communis]
MLRLRGIFPSAGRGKPPVSRTPADSAAASSQYNKHNDMTSHSSPMPPAVPEHVPETAFGLWFLRTPTWTLHVLERAMQDLERLIPARRSSYPVVADVGCGWGRSLKKLHQRFAPQRLIGMDIDPAMIAAARSEAEAEGLRAEFI